MRIKSVVLSAILGLLFIMPFGIMIINHDEGNVDGYTEQTLGDVATNVLTMNFDEDYDYADDEMKYDPEYIFDLSSTIASAVDETTKKVYDYSNYQHDGILSAGPTGKWDEAFNADKHDIPKRTHTAIQGRAIEFWGPPQEDFIPMSDCRYVRIQMDDSLKLINSQIPFMLYRYYEFEIWCWPYETDYESSERVLLNNLWTNPSQSETDGIQGWYRIKLDGENHVKFEYPIFN